MEPGVNRVRRARAFAVAAHGGQQYGDEPYVVHLDEVAEIVRAYGAEAQVVAYLHDVVEDTDVTLDQLRETFGEDVANQVELLTDEPGADWRWRKERTNYKLLYAGEDRRLALVVTAADRLANLRRASRDGSSAKLAMYRAEHAAFRKAAYRPGLCDALWAEMDAIVGAG